MTESGGVAQGGAIFFLHIPKTGGVSFQHALADGLEPSRTSQSVLGRQYMLSTWPDLARRDLVAGHLPWAVRHLLRRPCRTVTLLRDPLERTISAFQHIARSRHHRLHRQLSSEAPTLELAVRHPVLRFHFLSPCTRLLGCDERALVDALATTSEEERTKRVGAALAALPLDHEPDEAMLGRALTALAQIDFVGLTDDLEIDGPRCLAGLRGLTDAVVPRLNAAPQPARASNLPADLRHELTTLLRHDLQIWEAGRERVRRDRASAATGDSTVPLGRPASDADSDAA